MNGCVTQHKLLNLSSMVRQTFLVSQSSIYGHLLSPLSFSFAMVGRLSAHFPNFPCCLRYHVTMFWHVIRSLLGLEEASGKYSTPSIKKKIQINLVPPLSLSSNFSPQCDMGWQTASHPQYPFARLTLVIEPS